MVDKPSADRILLAPGAASGARAYSLPGSAASPVELPPVDARLVEPETRWEQIDGQRVYAMPANAPHGDSHSQLDYVVRAHVNEGYIASTDLLTRADATSDFATDLSLRRAGEDPATGGRHLEEVAFEIANTQSLRDLTRRAHKLTRRGVRRFFAILVQEKEVREWLPDRTGWQVLSPDGTIEDSTLKRPLRIRALLDAASADRAVAEALWAKEEPFLVELNEHSRAEGEAKGRAEGEAVGWAKSIFHLLTRRGLQPSPEIHDRIAACRDDQILQRWLVRAAQAESLAEVFEEDSEDG